MTLGKSSDEAETRTKGRWPAWVFDEGSEPDYRFSFANERTFLAWIRTALALVAAGVALDVVDLSVSAAAQRALATVLIVLGLLCAGAAWLRWASAERAMRREEPLPSARFGAALTIALIVSVFVLAWFL